MNHLIDRFGGEGWLLHVDVDEFLVLPEIEHCNLVDHYLPYLNRNGFEAVRACMIDMYAAVPGDGANYQPGTDPVECCPHFDPDIEFFGSLRPPYWRVRGGVRARMFGQNFDTQMKTPLIRSDIGIRLVSSSHVITPARRSDLSGAVLHYKFLGNFEDRTAEEADRKEHWNGATQVIQLRDKLDAMKNVDWSDSRTETYRHSQQLIDLGLIQAGGFEGP